MCCSTARNLATCDNATELAKTSSLVSPHFSPAISDLPFLARRVTRGLFAAIFAATFEQDVFDGAQRF